ncbi:hypothetical protein ACN47E_002090 [Coniothyrium glycines]
MESRQRERVAVVGSGLAGLVTAHLLANDPRQRYDITIFESGSSPSLDAASISIPNAAESKSDRVDLPMRAFAGGYYTNLKALYDYLGVQYRQQPFLFEFSASRPQSLTRPASANTAYFVHASNLHRVAPRPTQISNLAYAAEVLYLIACYAWFSLCCFLVAPAQGETVEQYVSRTRIPHRFTAFYLLPLISSVTTCPHQALLAFPATDLTGYKRKTHRAPHYTVSEGVRGVQERLLAGVEVVVNTTITAVRSSEKAVTITWDQGHGTELRAHKETFDKVVLAVSPDVVGRIFEPLRHHMSRIPTTLVQSLVHNDRTILSQNNAEIPDARNAQLIKLHTSVDQNTKTESHHIQPCGAIVTTCPFSHIQPKQIVHSAKFTRVLRSPESQIIVNAIFEGKSDVKDEKSAPLWRNGDDHVWLVGGWCWDGMVLLEGCVVSSMRVADALDVEVPWRHGKDSAI